MTGIKNQAEWDAMQAANPVDPTWEIVRVRESEDRFYAERVQSAETSLLRAREQVSRCEQELAKARRERDAFRAGEAKAA